MTEGLMALVVDLALLRREYRENEWYDAADSARGFMKELGFEVRDDSEGQKIRMEGASNWVKV